MTAGLNFDGLNPIEAAFGAPGFTVPATADPFSGVATRAFLVVFSELISDFFWIFKFLAPRGFFIP
jgi:hypothetical protein